MKKAFILLCGGDTSCKGTHLGLESLFRKRELQNFIIAHPEYRFEILLAAGNHPVHKNYPQLKKVMAERLQPDLRAMHNQGMISYIPSINLLEPDVWNSSNECLAAALFLEVCDVQELFVVSSKTHKRRILYIGSLIGGFTIHFISAPTRNYWRSVVYEAFALLKVFLFDRKFLRKKEFSSFHAAKSLAINY